MRKSAPIKAERDSARSLVNLVVIRSSDMEASKAFYERIGLTFASHRHGKGARHYACEMGSMVFEIYPLREVTSAGTRLVFQVSDVDALMATLSAVGVDVLSTPQDSPWGRRAVVRDPDGHSIELTEPIN